MMCIAFVYFISVCRLTVHTFVFFIDFIIHICVTSVASVQGGPRESEALSRIVIKSY